MSSQTLVYPVLINLLDKLNSLTSMEVLVHLKTDLEKIIEVLSEIRRALVYVEEKQMEDRSIIEEYKRLLFPTWVKLLTNVVEIQLSHCSECEDLPPLGHLPLLRKLCITGMDSLKCINKELYGIATSSAKAGRKEGKGVFPSLEGLEFRELHNWEKWQVFDNEKVFLCLKKLRLHECPKLAFLPFSTQHSAAKFEISKCEKLIMRALPI